MSSLRLALKQSLAESGQQQAPRKRDTERRKKDGRRRRKGEQPRKRGPGRPRKDGTSAYYSPDDEESNGSSSSENEFSGSSDNDTKPASVDRAAARVKHDSESGDHSSDGDDSVRRRKKIKKKRAIKKHRDTAANRIQSQWKKKKGSKEEKSTHAKQVMSQEHAVARKPKSSEKLQQESTATTGSGKAKTVPPPAHEIISHIAGLSVESQRKHLAAGLRVKVRFEMKKKKDGKLIRRRKWYGGLVTGASKGGSKIRIKYDDGTTEVSKYPDEDVVVDAVGNGRHRVPDDFFLPPVMSEESDDDNMEDEPESPAPRYAVSADNKGSRDERDSPKPRRKMTPSSKSPSRDRRISKTKDTEELKEPADPDTPLAPPEPPIDDYSKSPSPVFRGVQLSHSHDSSETSGSKNVRKREDDSVESAEHDDVAEMAVDESVDIPEPASNAKEIEGSPQTVHDEVERYSLSSSATKVRKQSPARNVMSKKPSLTIRLKPPRSLREDSKEPGAVIEEETKVPDHDDSSSDEDMSVDGMENIASGTVDALMAGSSITTSTDLTAKAEDGSAVTRISDPKVHHNVGEVSTGDTTKDQSLAGSKRPVPSGTDDDQPPKKKHSSDPNDEEQRGSVHTDAGTSEFSVVGAKGDAAAIERMPSTDSAVVIESESVIKGKTEKVASDKLEVPTSIEKQSVAGEPLEPKRPLLTAVVGKKSEKPENKKSGSPLYTEGLDDNVKGSPKGVESPKALSLDPKQSSSVKNLSTPLSSVASPPVSKLGSTEGDIAAKRDPVLKGSKNSAFEKKTSAVPGEDAELKTMPTVTSRSDEDLGSRAMTPTNVTSESKGSTVGVARSGRRAAQQANQRIASRQELVIQDPFAKAKKKRGKMDTKVQENTGKRKNRRGERDEDEDDGRHWVRCDNCQKWRLLPRTVETEKLPKHWYCEMNVYDSAHNSCDAPEQKFEEETKKKKRKRGRPRTQTPTERQESKEDIRMRSMQEPASMEPSAGKGKQRTPSRSPSLESREKLIDEESPQKGRKSYPTATERASPSNNDMDSGGKADSSARKQQYASSAKKSKSFEADEELNNSENEEIAAEVSVPKKRGRKKKVKAKVGKAASKDEDDADNQEWVQCEKCEKWRRLPPNISSEDLPEVWYCNMNTWDKASASCDIEEEKGDPNVREYNIFGTGQSSYGTSGKLSYRNLIFAKTGKRHNRLVSERTRAAESLFATIPDEDSEDIVNHTVKYAHSSAFVPRKSNATTLDDTRRVSLFDFMHHSNLWAELRLGSNGNPHSHIESPEGSFDGLSAETKRSLKEFVFHALGTGSLAGHEVLLEAQCRQWETSQAKWEGLRACCTLDVVTGILQELVQDGLVEVVPESALQVSAVDKSPRYRRISAATLLSSSPPSLSKERASSRCMKISKPWKNRQ